MTPRSPRIGLAGFFLEANRFAPVTTGAHFKQSCDRFGADLLAELRAVAPRTLPDSQGFMAGMDASGSWEPVPLRMALAYPGGPVEHSWWTAFVADMDRRLSDAGPLDGVFVCSHGAALTTAEDNPDGVLFELIRQRVGADVPVIAVLDLHTNVSQRMTDALSGFVAYRTNPHVDLFERGREAAQLMRRMLVQGAGRVALQKLPFIPASTEQLITPESPYGRLLAQAGQVTDAQIANLSLCGGFAQADSPHCGFSVVATALPGKRPVAEVAATAARAMAAQVWALRHEFVSRLTSIDEAVRLAVQAGAEPDDGSAALPRLVLADVADNPGGGGGGNTTALLQALLSAGAQRVLLGVFTDAPLAAQAHRLGVGAVFEAQFNRDVAGDPFVQGFVHKAHVVSLCDGHFIGRQGLVQGSLQSMGPSALLCLDGVRVAVISQRQQLLDPAQLEVLGVDLRDDAHGVRTLVVKSRGHFRAAFSDFAPSERVLEVDGPGLTTPVLSRLPLQRVPRPAFPLDPETRWP